MLSSAVSAVVLEQAPSGGGDGSLSVGLMGAQVADDFSFATNVALTDISWWGSYVSGPQATESFTIRIFGDNGSSAPNVAPLFETSFSGNGDSSESLADLYGGTVYRYDITLASALMLTGGVDYYLSVFNDDDRDEWYWLESASGDNLGWSRASDADEWGLDNNDPQNGVIVNMSYKLTADPVAVPAPAPLLLMGLPLLWFGRRFILKR